MTNWFDRIRKYYDAGLWTEKMVGNAVAKKKITAEQYKKITEKVAYLKGLAEGMELDTEKKEGKLLAAIIDVLGARTTLNLLLLLVVESLAADDDTTPVARLAATCSLLGGEHDRFCGSTLGDEFTTALHDE